MTFKDTGIVIRETHVGESDKIATVLFAERGKIGLSVRGARKPGSKFLASVQQFCLSEFVVFSNKGLNTVTQADLIESHYGLRGNLETLCCASFLAEMADKLIYPDIPAGHVLALLKSAYRVMSAGKMPPRLAASIFQFKLMQQEGYAPELEGCSGCGARVGPGDSWFCGEGLLCGGCAQNARALPVKLTEAARYAVEYILNAEPDKLFSFKLAEPDLDSLWKAARVHRDGSLDIKFRSLELL